VDSSAKKGFHAALSLFGEVLVMLLYTKDVGQFVLKKEERENFGLSDFVGVDFLCHFDEQRRERMVRLILCEDKVAFRPKNVAEAGHYAKQRNLVDVFDSFI
jgi:hypothetical protein